MSNPYLLFSSLFVLLPLSFFYFKEYKNNYEYFLAILLIINLILSLLFWSNPIKQGLIHKIDAFFARVSLISFILYVIFLKNTTNSCKTFFLIISSIGIIMFLYGDKESCENWCSKNHTKCHMFFHTFAFIAACCAFV